MIKKLTLASAVAATVLMTGCSVSPMAGALYTKQQVPVTTSSNATGSKTGVSDKCVSILGLVAQGDCSIANAKKNGGITKVSSVDFKHTNLLGIINTGRTVVHGN